MKGFNWAGDLNGHKNPIIRKMYVADATAIEKGEPLIYTQGTGVAAITAPTDFDDPIDGVSLVEKAANDGVTQIDVSVSPTALYRYKCSKVYTLTGGSTTTAVDSSIVPQTDNFWIGGAIRIVTCAADSSLVGRVVKIADSTGSTGSLALAETLPAALASGDTIQLCPGYMAEGYLGYDLDSDSMNPDFDAIGGNVLKIQYTNPDTMEMVVTFEKFAVVS
jgi:hypothetical protein